MQINRIVHNVWQSSAASENANGWGEYLIFFLILVNKKAQIMLTTIAEKSIENVKISIGFFFVNLGGGSHLPPSADSHVDNE